MAMLKDSQHVAAGVQFNGTPGRGLFNIPNSGGLIIPTLEFHGGPEAGKNLTVYRVNELGTQGAKIYEKLAFAEYDVIVVAAIPLGPGEKLQVITTGLTAEAFFTVYYTEPVG